MEEDTLVGQHDGSPIWIELACMNSAPGLPFFDVGALAVNCQGAGQPDGSGME